MCCRSNREIVNSYEEDLVEYEPMSNIRKIYPIFSQFDQLTVLFINDLKFSTIKEIKFSEFLIFVHIWVNH